MENLPKSEAFFVENLGGNGVQVESVAHKEGPRGASAVCPLITGVVWGHVARAGVVGARGLVVELHWALPVGHGPGKGSRGVAK